MKKQKKLSLKKETVKDLKIQTTIKAGAPDWTVGGGSSRCRTGQTGD